MIISRQAIEPIIMAGSAPCSPAPFAILSYCSHFSCILAHHLHIDPYSDINSYILLHPSHIKLNPRIATQHIDFYFALFMYVLPAHFLSLIDQCTFGRLMLWERLTECCLIM